MRPVCSSFDGVCINFCNLGPLRVWQRCSSQPSHVLVTIFLENGPPEAWFCWPLHHFRLPLIGQIFIWSNIIWMFGFSPSFSKCPVPPGCNAFPNKWMFWRRIPKSISINGSLAFKKGLCVWGGRMSLLGLEHRAICLASFESISLNFYTVLWPSTIKNHTKIDDFWSNLPNWIDFQILPKFSKTCFWPFSAVFRKHCIFLTFPY